MFAVCLCLLVPLAGDLDLVRDRLSSESDSEYLFVLTALSLVEYEADEVCDLSLFLLLSLFPLLLLLLLLAARLPLSLDVDLALLTCVLSLDDVSLALLLHAFS